MQIVAYVIAGLAIAVMAVNAVQAVQLARRLLGGEVGERWRLLTGLIVVFFFGYLVSPAAIYFQASPEVMNVMMFGVFLFGAIFVLVVIGIVRQVLSFLKLLK